VHRASLLPEDAARLLGPLGVDLRIGRQLLASSVGRGEAKLGPIAGIKKSVLAAVEAATRAEPLPVLERVDGPDQFRKYLFAVEGGVRVEAVRIPVPCEAPGADLAAFEGKERKYLVCVSSQVGCALGCSFCATGALGFSRNLSADEIVRQVLAIRAEADRPVRGVLFMGMGEPFLNYDAVIQAARILSHPCGGAIDGKAITISTAGVVPAIRRFTAEGHKFRLAVSLTQAASERRRPLMPIEETWPVAEVVAALHDHARERRTRVLVEYVLLAGQNDRPEDAEALGRLLDRRLVKLDLIDYNGRVGGHVRTSDAARSAFIGALQRAGVPFGVRYSGGQEIGAGCGQLAGGESKNETARSHQGAERLVRPFVRTANPCGR
jgi:23S rRNA (adenine2503-C2)-methyltransferase